MRGEKIRLRPPDSPRDHELLVQWRNDPAIAKMFYDDEPVSMDSHLKWWAKVSADLTQRNYMIDALDISPEDPTNPSGNAYIPVGMTALVNMDFRNRTVEYGRLKIDPQYQGRGYAFDAEITLMRHAFDALNMHRVWLHALDYNEAVIKLHEKTGFSHEGCLRQHIYKNGQYYDVVTMGLLAETFQEKFPRG